MKHPKPKFPVGTKFLPRRARKSGAVHTVIGHRYVYDVVDGDEKIQVLYISEHKVMGQTVRAVDNETTVAMGVEELKETEVRQ